MRRFACLLLLIQACFLLVPAANADHFTFIFEKQQAKEKDRWTLPEWLQTRDRMRLQDLWLAMHMPSPYEFYLATDYKLATLNTGGGYHGWDFAFAAYAYFMGVEIQRQTSNIDSRWVGIFNVRLLGPYNQATNLTLQGGVKQESRGSTSLVNPLASISATAYITKAFGAELLYRRYFAIGGGVPTPVDRLEAGAFIDFKFIRLFGDYIAETASGNATRSFRGFKAGTRVYF